MPEDNFSMSDEDKPIAISDKVEILSTDDEKIKAIGEILSTDKSRKILTFLFNNSLTANEISQKTEISLPLVIYHLKKMQEAGVVKITSVGKNTKSHDMKFYTIDKFAIVILPNQMSKPAKTSKSLFNSFTRIHRMATLGAVCVAAWFSTKFLHGSNTTIISDEMAAKDGEAEFASREAPPETMMQSTPVEEMIPSGEPVIDFLWPIISVLSVIVIGLIIEILIKSKKETTL